MKTFKKYFDNKILKESVFDYAYPNDEDSAIYINPQAREVENIKSDYLRWLSSGDDIFIWDSNILGHSSAWYKIKELDPENPSFKKDEPDICFYLDKEPNTGIFNLYWSQFTGELRKEKFSGPDDNRRIVILSKLMKMPVMRRLKGIILNADEFDYIPAKNQEGKWEPYKSPPYRQPNPKHFEPSEENPLGGKNWFPHGTRPNVYKGSGD